MGPLSGVRVVEFEAIGPGPFCGMMLADMGADVLRVDRLTDARSGFGRERKFDITHRGRRSVTLDLKKHSGVAAALALVRRADALIEGFRPGTMERLGLGPDVVLAAQPRIVYGRMTGWGQQGPLSARAGHDINYIALSGILHSIGRLGQAPVPPLNVVGDYGGGGMLLAFGIACGLLEARTSGKGQVVDAAMVDGASLLATMFHGLRAAGSWSDTRGTNVLDGAAPWYDVYETGDGKYVAVGAIEPQFYSLLLQGLGLEGANLPLQNSRDGWPVLRERFASVFRTRSRDEWTAIFQALDACCVPVLNLEEARNHAQALSREAFADVSGISQPSPAPRFSRTPGALRGGPPERGESGGSALVEWGFDKKEIEELAALGLGWSG